MKKYALVVGIGHYADPEIADLEFAAADLAAVARWIDGTDKTKEGETK